MINTHDINESCLTEGYVRRRVHRACLITWHQSRLSPTHSACANLSSGDIPIHVWHDSFVCRMRVWHVTCLIRMHMKISAQLIASYMCDMTHSYISYMGHDSFIYLIYGWRELFSRTPRVHVTCRMMTYKRSNNGLVYTELSSFVILRKYISFVYLPRELKLRC